MSDLSSVTAMQKRQPIGEGRPVWDDVAPPEDIAALDPGVPDVLPKTADVCVIGGGLIGLAIAAACRRAGAGDVLLLERGRLCSGPSGRNGGFLIPADHPEWPDACHALGERSLEMHRELDAECGTGLRNLDLLVMPDLLLERQAHVEPLRVGAAFARRAGVVATGVEATVESGGAMRVHTPHGVIEPGAVVIATGSLSEKCGDVPQRFVKGHVVATEPAAVTLERMLVPGHAVGIVQLPGRRLLCGGTKDFDDHSPAIDDTRVAFLREVIVDAVPEAAGLEITHSWTCFRPRTSDGIPVIDRLPNATNVWVVGGLYSTGLLMAPAVGELVADWITTGRAPAAEQDFGLSRAALRSA
jgi:glycine/D-amino acid oxidase-like deaminating enzyme